MNAEDQERRKHKQYDETFKRTAAERWLQGGKSVSQIAGNLGIGMQALK